MESRIRQKPEFKTWALIVVMVGIVVFQGWFAFTLIGDLGQPGWDYRPIPDVPGSSSYAAYKPYTPQPCPQHVRTRQCQEAYPLGVMPLQGVK
jgi:hypothetical protein